MRATNLSGLLRQAGSTLRSLRGSAGTLLRRLDLSRNWLMTVALIGILGMMLCGCSPRVVRPSLPPQAEARAVPEFEGSTYRDALLYLIELREMAYACEIDKSAIREVFGE